MHAFREFTKRKTKKVKKYSKFGESQSIINRKIRLEEMRLVMNVKDQRTLSPNFYEKVVQKFGGYGTPHTHTTEYPDENPEKVFKEKLLGLSGKDKQALDIGCADGRFTLSIAPYFKKIIAIDLSKGMLEAAKRLQKEKGVKNVSFQKQDAQHTTSPDAFFDVVYSRRGPSDFKESYRLLKIGEYFVEIGIGEKDCQEIKQIFGRGQGFGD